MASTLFSSKYIWTKILCLYQISPLPVRSACGNANTCCAVHELACKRITKATGTGGSTCWTKTPSRRPSRRDPQEEATRRGYCAPRVCAVTTHEPGCPSSGLEARRPPRLQAQHHRKRAHERVTNTLPSHHPSDSLAPPPAPPRKQSSRPGHLNIHQIPSAREDGLAVGDALLRSHLPHATPDRTPRVQLPDRTNERLKNTKWIFRRTVG